MAKDTPKAHRGLVIYEIFARNHSSQGNFQGVIDDLPRIKSLCVDMIWLMPIHPIGVLQRKGTLGSPYSISDYFSINPDYGTLEDFTRLVKKAHDLDLKVMLGVVYNHTAHDALILKKHPDWYHTGLDGKPATTVPDWSDVIDLDFSRPELWQYLISALEQWARLGVDGFRCDVASIVPFDFWLQARAAIQKINPRMIWLAESVEARWIPSRRSAGLRAHSDSELYQAFDITYDYDIFDAWKNTVKGELKARYYLDLLHFQDAIYPYNYVKLRCVENHDQERIMSFAQNKTQALAWTAFQAFNKGAWLVYAGQESACTHPPSLFEREPIQWGKYEFAELIRNLALIKKDIAVSQGELLWLKAEPAIMGIWYTPHRSLAGVFNFSGQTGEMETGLPDGIYKEHLSGGSISIQNGRILLPESAAIFNCQPVHPLPALPMVLL